VLIEAGNAIEPLVVVQMDDLLIRARVAQSDIFAVGLGRSHETHDWEAPGHLV
jgi:hypothetical protein